MRIGFEDLSASDIIETIVEDPSVVVWWKERVLELQTKAGTAMQERDKAIADLASLIVQRVDEAVSMRAKVEREQEHMSLSAAVNVLEADGVDEMRAWAKSRIRWCDEKLKEMRIIAKRDQENRQARDGGT